MFFSSVWDPKYIIFQIAAVQSLYYVQFGVTLLIINQLTGHMFSVEQVFNYRLTNTHSSHGWVVIISTIVNSVLGAGSLLFIVERSKKCLDHSVTVVFLHFIVCSFYAGVPSSLAWWVVTVIGCILMAVIGEYICMRRELQEIPITTKGFGASPASPPSLTPTHSTGWGKGSAEEDREGLVSSAGGFGGVVGVSGVPLGDFVGNPVATPKEDFGETVPRYGSGEITPRFGSGEFTPRFGSGLGFSSVYHTQPSPAPASVSINISV
eukprot:Phypoly_transcript_15383.p1 GENE.Phypoly_transcript_15383~~Phypoly_transcript_15383.p1  ORF type:complete len:265 (+),score=45.95 Phypoly_transcript_15383:63-857(+)